eukprot:GILJ01007400.1.p2 GENE.GILJ01007400.1~~GILJ01007400.1.p2  ORF type:complete len:151 (+),score=10.59 GILJ01007400.1:211-663(+)
MSLFTSSFQEARMSLRLGYRPHPPPLSDTCERNGAASVSQTDGSDVANARMDTGTVQPECVLEMPARTVTPVLSFAPLEDSVTDHTNLVTEPLTVDMSLMQDSTRPSHVGHNMSNEELRRCVRCVHLEALRDTLREEVRHLEQQLTRSMR